MNIQYYKYLLGKQKNSITTWPQWSVIVKYAKTMLQVTINKKNWFFKSGVFFRQPLEEENKILETWPRGSLGSLNKGQNNLIND